MKKLNNIITVLTLTLLSSCTSSTSSTNTEESQKKLVEEKTIHDLKKLIKDLPSPSLVPFTLKSVGAKFDKEHINSLESIEFYKKDRDKLSLNMGIYASDINYLAAYGYEQDCIEYLKASHKIAQLLGDSAIYDEKDLNEFRGHIVEKNENEIAKILSKLFVKTSVKMEQDHHLTMASLALTGSFIEGLYQSVLTLETYPETEGSQKNLEPLVKITLNEEQALLDVIKILEDLPLNNTIADLMTELSILDQLYKGDLKEVEEKMENDPDFVLTKDVMRDITLEVKRIRNKVIEK